MVQDGPAMIWAVAAFGPFLLGLAIMIWWLLASGVTWKERFAALVGLIVTLVVVIALLDSTMRGAPVIVMTLPLGVAGFAVGAILARGKAAVGRVGVTMLLTFLAAGITALLKTDGVWGNFSFGLTSRWTATAEDQFLASRNSESDPGNSEAIPTDAFSDPDWPGFRGPQRDGAERGMVFESDWQAHPPVERWRIKVGPSWSSFAVAGDYLLTQEQRGDDEVTVCYRGLDGRELWAHAVPSRFFESLGGLGPRATPTIADGHIYSLGAEGWLQKLNATNGESVWKVDLRDAASRQPPMWGFSSSPLVTHGVVVVHAGGAGDRGILAFDEESGALKWSAAAGEMSYGSLQVVKLLGRELVGLLTDSGAQFHDPATGQLELNYEWRHEGYRALQPGVIGESQILIPTGLGSGTRLVEVRDSEGKLVADEKWTSRDLKPDFNDVVIYDGHAYGFDNSIFACVDLADGSLKWKDGRYGKGQVLLLADSGLLLVVSETGELILLEATGGGHKELAKLKALSGKTWNHPVVVGNRLFVRNAAEAVCYELPMR
jgi:outer membrane protein assembly factor BamB